MFGVCVDSVGSCEFTTHVQAVLSHLWLLPVKCNFLMCMHIYISRVIDKCCFIEGV